MGIGPKIRARSFSFLEWWKYAFTHRLNPFFTHLQWAPSGTNLAWTGLIPLFGIVAMPITATLGPIVSYNLPMLLCPALAAWSAFLLNHFICSSFWPALAGGFVFGFSSYILGHILGAPNLVAVFPIPLLVGVTLLKLSGRLRSASYAAFVFMLVSVQFLCFPELLVTASLWGTVAIIIAWLIAPHMRTNLQALICPTACGYAATAILMSPYIYYVFAFGQPRFPASYAAIFSALPSNCLVPTTSNLFGTLTIVRKLSRGSHIYETGAYVALPLFFIVASFAYTRWHEWRTRLLINVLAIISIASLGPTLHLWDEHSLLMPWLVFSHFPLRNPCTSVSVLV